MEIRLGRVYDDPARGDGFRALVDRLWPRGISKDTLAMDLWAKDLAPSAALRKAYHGTDRPFAEFREAYLDELAANPEATDALFEAVRKSRKKSLTLLYASRDAVENHAVVLRAHLIEILA